LKTKILSLIFIYFILNLAQLKAQIINIEDKRVRLGDSITLKGFMDLGLNFYKNDKHLTSARAVVQVEKLIKKHFLLFLGGYNFVKGEGQSFLNDGFIHLRYNTDLSDKWVFEGFTQAQYNERTRMLFRGLVGTGVRYKIRLAKTQRIYLGLAYMFENDQFKDAIPRQNDSRISSYLSYNVQLSHNSKLVHTTYFQPILTDFGNYRLSSEAAVLLNITKRLIFKLTANISNDNDPRLPKEVPNFTYTWVNGLRWDF
jgi:Protein of unknown function, DUF481